MVRLALSRRSVISERPGKLFWILGLGCVVEALLAWRLGASAALPAYLYFGALGVTLTVLDVSARRMPNLLVLPSYPIALILLTLAASIDGSWWPLARAGLGMIALAGLFLILALSAPGQLGMGDCKLAGVVGLYLGWLGLSDVLTGILLAYLGAALMVIVLRVVGSSVGRRGLPFAPFMAGGALFAVLFVR
jgi:leader peptidase (prepilin peptidase)/N-methyltransferase